MDVLVIFGHDKVRLNTHHVTYEEKKIFSATVNDGHELFR